MTSRRALATTGLAVLCGVVPAACGGIPDSGSVTRVDPTIDEQEERVESIPAPPDPGASPEDIVTGFYLSMAAYPLTTDFAEEYLTTTAASTWDPWQETIVYERHEDQPIGGDVVRSRVELDATLSERDSFHPYARSAFRTIDFTLRREGGEWRIANPGDALYVDRVFFESYYEAYSLYFVAPSGDLLVPDPIYLPTGDQLATSLLRGLLSGPTPASHRQLRTAVPQMPALDAYVSMRAGGQADVQLPSQALAGTPEERSLMSAQIVFTLSQVLGVEVVRILVDDAPLEIQGIPAEQDLDLWSGSYDPTGYPPNLYALRAGRVVQVNPDPELDPDVEESRTVRNIKGTWGSHAQGIAAFDIDDVTLQRLVAVSSDRHRLLGGATFYAGEGVGKTVLYEGGVDLSDPTMLDSGDTLVVDRLAQSSRLLAVDWIEGGARQLGLEGLADTRVDSFTLSPDGMRFAAIVRDHRRGGLGAPRAVIGDVSYASDGVSPTGFVNVRPLVTLDETLGEVHQLDWVDGTTLALLGRGTDRVLRVYTVRIDGFGLDSGFPSLPSTSPPVDIVASTTADAEVYVLDKAHGLWRWNIADGQWRKIQAEPLSALNLRR